MARHAVQLGGPLLPWRPTCGLGRRLPRLPLPLPARGLGAVVGGEGVPCGFVFYAFIALPTVRRPLAQRREVGHVRRRRRNRSRAAVAVDHAAARRWAGVVGRGGGCWLRR